jgi:hypothetical protein
MLYFLIGNQRDHRTAWIVIDIMRFRAGQTELVQDDRRRNLIAEKWTSWQQPDRQTRLDV